MTTITALPPVPQPADDVGTFNTKAFALVAALVQFVTETNAVAGETNTAASSAATSAAAALASKIAALASENAALASAQSAAGSNGAIAWVSGTTYAVGDPRWSPIDNRVYRRRTAGAGTTDPSADPTNWAAISANGLQLATVSGTSATLTANTDTKFTNSATCAATVPSLAVGEAIVVRFDNGRFDNTVDLGARSMVGPNGVICSGVITLNMTPMLALRWWGDYYRSN